MELRGARRWRDRRHEIVDMCLHNRGHLRVANSNLSVLLGARNEAVYAQRGCVLGRLHIQYRPRTPRDIVQ